MGDSTLNFCLHFRPGFVENLGFLHPLRFGRNDREAGPPRRIVFTTDGVKCSGRRDSSLLYA